MDNPESPVSSDSANTPLQDEHINSKVLIPDEPVEIAETGDIVEMAEEQLDYEEFIDNGQDAKVLSEIEEIKVVSEDEEVKVVSEAEDGECDSDDNIDESNESKIPDTAPLSVGEISDDLSINPDTESTSEPLTSGELPNHPDNMDTKEELAEGELKAEEEEPPAPETPWERGLRLARERRELAKLKKVQEKDKLKERQLNINLDGVEEVEPIAKPLITENKELNLNLLKALQPIVILPEDPKENEMILEYYLAEADYQHRPRFIPSKLYTLDPWEVEEWKRELDMIKFENEMASNKLRRPGKRSGRRSSCSSSASSRSSTSGRGRPMMNMPNRNYEHNTSQFAINRNRGPFNSTKKPQIHENNAVAPRQGKRDLPPEFKNRVPSSSRSSSRSSSGSHSTSSSSSSSSSSSQHSAAPAIVVKPRIQKVGRPQFQGVKKPALGRARSNSSASSSSSNSSSSSSGSSSSQSSGASNRSNKPRKSKTDKKFISTWTNKSKTAQLSTKIVSESALSAKTASGENFGVDMDTESAARGVVNGSEATAAMVAQDQDELPSATLRPGVKLKLLSRPKPVLMPSQGTTKKTPRTAKEKVSKKDVTKSDLAGPTTQTTNTAPSSIFNNSKSIFTHTSSNNNAHRSGDLPVSAKENTLKSDLVTTQLEMQQEFLRNYKDKIAIYRSQLSYQQHSGHGQSIYTGNLTHTQPPPIKGPITVMSVTSKKTGPPKAAPGKLADHYSQHEEHQSRHNHHHSPPAYRTDHRDKARNRSRSFEDNNRVGGGKSGFVDRGRNNDDWKSYNRGGGGSDGMRGRNENNTNRGREMFDKGDRGRDGYDKGRNEGGDRGREGYEKNRGGDMDRGREGAYEKERGARGGGRNEGDRGRYEVGDRSRNDRPRAVAADIGDRAGGGNRYNYGDKSKEERPRGDRNNRDYERNKEIDKFVREDRPPMRDRLRDMDQDRNRDLEKRFDQNRPLRPDLVSQDKTKSRSQKRDREPLDIVSQNHNNDDGGGGAHKTAVPTLPPTAAVPKEKRREELLKQLKAVEDAIAKKKAKIDK